MNDGFVFYRSFYESLEELPPEEYKECVTALCKYALDGEEMELSPTARMFFKLVRPQVDANNKRREAGRSGGRATRKQTPSNPEANTKQTSSKLVAKEKEKEKVKGKDKEREIALVMDAWSTLPDTIPKPRLPLTETRRRKLSTRINENGITVVLGAIKTASESRFLMGEKGWHMDFDWFIEAGNFQKVVEGNYKNARGKGNSFSQMQNNEYDFDELEKQLLGGQE